MGKQNFDRCRSVVLRRAHQRGLAVEVRGVDIGSVLEKHLHQLDVASFGGKHKCRVAVAVARIHIASPLKLGYRRLYVPLIGYRDQIIGLRIIPAHWQSPILSNPLVRKRGYSGLSRELSGQNSSAGWRDPRRAVRRRCIARLHCLESPTTEVPETY